MYSLCALCTIYVISALFMESLVFSTKFHVMVPHALFRSEIIPYL